MKKLLLAVSFFATAFGATPFWVEPCTNPKTGCIAGDPDLARWALQDWARASNGKLAFTEVPHREDALLRIVWALPEDGLYGETMPILVNGRPGAQLNINIAANGVSDPLLRDTIVYLTCLHESGHALGLPHTRNFADIMYSFQYGGDIAEYFDRYRSKLTTRSDIRKTSGLSPAERAAAAH